MAEQAPTLTRHDLEAKIVKRCWEDEEFREEFSADPAGAFVRYLGIPAASLPKISVHQEKPGSWHIVLPVKPAHAGELSDQDVERVAGAGVSGFYSATLTRPLASIAGSVAAAGAAVASVAVSVEKTVGW
jgi:hypothetical protein